METEKELNKERSALENLTEYLQAPPSDQIVTLGLGYAFREKWDIVQQVFLPAYEEIISSDPMIDVEIADFLKFIDSENKEISVYGLMLATSLFRAHSFEYSDGVLNSFACDLYTKIITEDFSVSGNYHASLALIEADKKTEDLDLNYASLIGKVSYAIGEEIIGLSQEAKDAILYLSEKL